MSSSQVGGVGSTDEVRIRSREYKEFKDEYMPKHMGWYEKACNYFEGIVKLAPDPKKQQYCKLQSQNVILEFQLQEFTHFQY